MGTIMEREKLSAYERHRKRVQEIKSLINNKPPVLHAGNFARFGTLKQDVLTYFSQYKENIKLLVNINRTARTKGVVDTFRIGKTGKVEKSQLPRIIWNLRDLEKRNVKLGKRLLCVKGTMKKYFSAIPKLNKKPLEPFIPPLNILNKYINRPNMKIPNDIELLRKLLRPIVFFDLEMIDSRPLGRISIQLYTEAAPQVVLEFVRICFYNEYERISIVRLFTNLWANCELKLKEDTLIDYEIEYDKRAIDHGLHSGVLSFSLDHLRYMTKDKFRYSISFKPLRVLNGQRVGFGHILYGFRTLFCLQDYATKNGKPIKKVKVKECGIINKY